MKQKDIALIIIVIFVSAVMSILLSNMLISSPKNRQEKVEVVGAISPEFKEPDKKYFNSSSIDPTLVIEIGNNSNKQPFNDKAQ